jgi:hypothetical protein
MPFLPEETQGENSQNLNNTPGSFFQGSSDNIPRRHPMSGIRNLLKKATDILFDSGINTCYTVPEVRANRIPAYFEQLEPRQLLDAALDNSEPDFSAVSLAPAALGDLSTENIVPDARTFMALDAAELKVAMDVSTEFRFYDDDGNLSYGNSDEFTATLQQGQYSAWVSNDNDTLVITSTGDLDFGSLNFSAATSLKSLVIRVDGNVSFTTDTSLYSDLRGCSLTIGAGNINLDGWTFNLFDNSGLNLLAGGSITLDSTNIVKNILNNATTDASSVLLAAEDISLTDSSVTLDGEFSAQASSVGYVHPLLSLLPVKIAQSEASVAIADSLIKAGSLNISAVAVTTVEANLFNVIDKATGLKAIQDGLVDPALLHDHLGLNVNVDGSGNLSFVKDASWQGSSSASADQGASIADLLDSIIGGLDITVLPVVFSFGTAEARVTVSDSTLTATGQAAVGTEFGSGDVSLRAVSSVENQKSKTGEPLVLALAVNESTAGVTLTDTVLTATRDIRLGSDAQNINNVAIVAANTGLTEANTALAVGISINSTLAQTVIQDAGAAAALTAGRDIAVHASALETIRLSVSAAPGADGNLGLALAFSFGEGKASAKVDAALTAGGSVSVTSVIDSRIITYTNTSIPLSGTLNIGRTLSHTLRTPEQRLTGLVLSFLPTEAIGEALESLKLGLGLGLSLAVRGSAAETVIGPDAVITALGRTTSSLPDGTGAVRLDAVAYVTPATEAYTLTALDSAYIEQDWSGRDGIQAEDKAVSLAVGIALFSNAAAVRVREGAKIRYNSLLDINADAQYLTRVELKKRRAAQAGEEDADSAQAVEQSSIIDQGLSLFTDVQQWLGETLLGADVINVASAASGALLANTVVSAAATGGREASVALSLAYVQQKNSSEAIVGVNEAGNDIGRVDILYSGSVSALTGGKLTLDDNGLYADYAGNVVYQVAGDTSALTGLNAGASYYAVVGSDGKLNLYTYQGGNEVTTTDTSLASNAQHYFIFTPHAAAGGTATINTQAAATADTLSFASGHGLQTGDIVTADSLVAATSGQAFIDQYGLTSGKFYYVEALSATDLKLREVQLDSVTRKATGLAAAYVTFELPAVRMIGLDASLANEATFINALTTKLTHGEIIRYQCADPANALTGLESGAYYKVVIAGGKVSFRACDANGVLATDDEGLEKPAIELTAPGAAAAQSAHYFDSVTPGAMLTRLTGAALEALGLGLTRSGSELAGDNSGLIRKDAVNGNGSSVLAATGFLASLRDGDVIQYTTDGTAIDGLENNGYYRVTLTQGGLLLQKAPSEDGTLPAPTLDTDYDNEPDSVPYVRMFISSEARAAAHSFTQVKSARAASLTLNLDTQTANDKLAATLYLGSHSWQTGEQVTLSYYDDETKSYKNLGSFTVELAADPGCVRLKDAGGQYFTISNQPTNRLTFRLTPAAATPSGTVSNAQIPDTGLSYNGFNPAALTKYQAVILSGAGEISLTDAQGQELVYDLAESPRLYYAGLATDGSLLLAAQYGGEACAAELSGGSATLTVAPRESAAQREDLALGASMLYVQNHGLQNGDTITLDIPANDYSGALSEIRLYQVATYGNDRFVLYAIDLNQSDAVSATALTLAQLRTAAGEAGSNTQAVFGLPADALLLSETGRQKEAQLLTSTAHGLNTGQAVRVSWSYQDDGGHPVTQTLTRYAIVVGDDTFRLAETRQDALNGLALLDFAGGAPRDSVSQISWQAVTTGININAYSADKTAHFTGRLGGTGGGSGKLRLARSFNAGALNPTTIGQLTADQNGKKPTIANLPMLASATALVDVVAGFKNLSNPPSKNAAGVAVQILNLKHAAQARLVAAGSSVVGDGLSISAENYNSVTGMTLAMTSGYFNLGGTLAVLAERNATLAEIALGADGKLLLGPGGLSVKATDTNTTTLISFVKSRGETAIGLSGYIPVIQRETRAGITGSDSGNAVIASRGAVEATALTGGRSFSALVNLTTAGAIDPACFPKPKPSADTQNKTTAETLATAVEMAKALELDLKNADVQDVIVKVVEKAVEDAQKFNPTEVYPPAATETTGVAGNIFVGVSSEETRVVIENIQNLICAGFLAEAVNETKNITVLAGVAISSGSAANPNSKANAGGGALHVGLRLLDTEAHVSGTGLRVTDGDAAVKARDDGLSVAIALGVGAAPNGSGAASKGIGGALLFNLRQSDTSAFIADSDLTIAQGSLLVEAVNDVMLVTVAGGGGGASAGANGSATGIGLSLGVNLLTGDTEAYVSNSGVVAYDKVTVRAIRGHDGLIDPVGEDIQENGLGTEYGGYNLIAIGASAGVATGGESATGIAGTLVLNVNDSDARAWINTREGETPQVITADGGVSVLALDSFGIISVGGGVSLASSDRSQGSTSIGGVVSVNIITSAAEAWLKNISINPNTGNNTQSQVLVQALSDQNILAIAGAASIALGQDASSLAVTLGANVLSLSAAATLDDVNLVANSLTVRALNEASILSIAGSVGVSGGGNAAAAVALNVIAGADLPALTADVTEESFRKQSGTGEDGEARGRLDVTARIKDSAITLYGNADDCLTVWAGANSAILAIAAGVGVSSGDDNINLAGSLNVNVIIRDVTAAVDSSTVAMNAGGARIVAREASAILAGSGQVGVSASNSDQYGLAVGVNVVANNVAARLKYSDFTQTAAAGGLSVEALSLAEILAVTAGVSVSTGGSAAAGALAVNVIDKSVSAKISGEKTGNLQKTVAGPLTVLAVDENRILSIAVAVALSGGGEEALGGVLAVNVITGAQLATVESAAISASGNMVIGAQNASSIFAVNAGLAGKAANIQGNVIINKTEARVDNADLASTGGYIVIDAAQGPESEKINELRQTSAANINASGKQSADDWIDKVDDSDNTIADTLTSQGISLGCGIFHVSLTLALNASDKGAAVAAAVAVNDITSDVLAGISASTLDAGGDLLISAVNSGSIVAVAVAAALATGSGATVSVNVAGNTVNGATKALTQASSLTAGGNLVLGAVSKSDILALGLNAAVNTGGSAAVGVFLGVNVIALDTVAEITGNDNYTLSAVGNLTVSADDKSAIWAATVAASVGSGAAVGIANNTSVIVSTIRAGITGCSAINAGNTLTVAALGSSQIVDIAIGVSAGTGSGAIQATAAENVIVREVAAELANIGTITVGGDLVVTAIEDKPSAIGDWRNKAYMRGVGVSDVNTDAFAASANNGMNENSNDAKVGAGNGTHELNPNAALFNPQNGIFSLVVAVAAAPGGTSVAGALNFNWLERSVTASVHDVTNIRFTNASENVNGHKSALTVEAKSSAAAFGGVLSVAAAGGTAAVAASGAINVLDNKTLALLENCSVVTGWNTASGGYADATQLGQVSVRAGSESGAVALAVAVGATGGSAGVGASVVLNLGMSGGNTYTGTQAKDIKGNLDNKAQGMFADLTANGAASHTSDQSGTLALGGEASEAAIINANVTSSGALVVEALQNSALMSVNLSVGAAGTAGVGAGIALNLISVNSAATVTDSSITAASAKVEAQNAGKAWSFLISVGASGTAGVAGVLSLSRVGGTARASVAGGSLTTTAGGITVSASGETDILTVGIAVGAGGAAGAAGAIAAAFAGNIVLADIDNVAVNASGKLSVSAKNTTSVITTAIGVAAAGTAAGAGSVALNLAAWGDPLKLAQSGGDHSATLNKAAGQANASPFQTRAIANLNGSSRASGVELSSINKSVYLGALVIVAASGAAAGAGGLALNLTDAVSDASLNLAANVTLNAGGAVSVRSENTTKMWAVVAAVAASGGGAGAGSVALNLAEISSRAAITGGVGASLTGATTLTVQSLSEADVYALAAAVAGSGAGAGAGALAVNAVTTPSVAAISGASADNFAISGTGAASVTSANKSQLVAGTVAVGASGAGAGAGSLAVNVSSTGQLENLAQNRAAAENNTWSIKDGSGKTLDNQSFAGRVENGYLLLGTLDNDKNFSRQTLNTSGINADKIHYLVLLDAQGRESVFSFKTSDVQGNRISLDKLTHVEGGITSATSLTSGTLRGADRDEGTEDDIGITYRASRYGADTYVSADLGTPLDKNASSGALVQNVNLTANGLKVEAASERLMLTVTAGAAGAGVGAGAGAVGVAVGNDRTVAAVRDSKLTLSAGSLAITATNKSGAYQIALAGAGAGAAAGSGAVSVLVESGDTLAELSNTTVLSSSNVNVNAAIERNALTVAVAGAGAGVGAGSGTVAVTVLQGGAKADVSGSNIQASGTVSVQAAFAEGAMETTLASLLTNSQQSELNDTLSAADGKVTEAKTDAAASGQDEVERANAQKDMDGNSANLSASGKFDKSLQACGILTVAVAGAGAGVGAGAGAIAVNRLDGDTQALVTGSVIQAGAFTALAELDTRIQSYTMAAAGGGVGAGAGAFNINSLSGATSALVENTKINVNGNASISAAQNLAVTGLAVQAAVGGIGAGGFGLVVNSLSGDVQARLSGGPSHSIVTTGALSVASERESAIRAYAIGVSGGVFGAFSGGVVVNDLSGSSTALIEGASSVSRLMIQAGSVSALATENIDSFTLGVQASGGLVGLAAGVAVSTASGDVQAGIFNADVSYETLIEVKARSDADLSIYGIGAGVGALGGVGVVVSDISFNGAVRADIENARLTGTDVDARIGVTAESCWDLEAFTLAGASGLAAAAAAISNVDLDGSSLEAHLRNVTLDGYAAVLDVQAEGRAETRAMTISPALSAVLAVGAALSDIDTGIAVKAGIDNLWLESAILSEPVISALADLKVKAEAEAWAFAVSVLVSGGGGGASITHDADVRAWAVNLFTPSAKPLESLSVKAKNQADLSTVSTGVSLGLLAGVGAGTAVINADTTTLAWVGKGSTIYYTNTLEVEADSKIKTKQSSVAGAGAIGLSVAATTAEQNLAAATHAGLGLDWSSGYSENAGGGIFVAGQDSAASVRALSEIESDQDLNAVAVGILSGTGAGRYLTVNLESSADFGKGAFVMADEIAALSQNTVKHVSDVDNVGVGLLAVGVGKSKTEVKAGSRVIVGENAVLESWGVSAKDVTGMAVQEQGKLLDKRLILEAFNILDAVQEQGYVSVSAVNIPVVHESLSAELTAEILVRKDARLATVNPRGADLILHAGSLDKADVAAIAKLSGLATVGNLDGDVSVTSNNKISVAEGAGLHSSGDLALAAGDMGYKFKTEADSVDFGVNFEDEETSAVIKAGIGGSYISLDGHIYDRTAIPASWVTGDVAWTVNNLIEAETTSALRARGNAELYADQGSYYNYKRLETHKWTAGLFEASGDDRVEQDLDNKVVMNGSLEAGVDNQITAQLYGLTKANWEWLKNESNHADIISATGCSPEDIEAEINRITAALATFKNAAGIDYFDYQAGDQATVTAIRQSVAEIKAEVDEYTWNDWAGFIASLAGQTWTTGENWNAFKLLLGSDGEAFNTALNQATSQLGLRTSAGEADVASLEAFLQKLADNPGKTAAELKVSDAEVSATLAGLESFLQTDLTAENFVNLYSESGSTFLSGQGIDGAAIPGLDLVLGQGMGIAAWGAAFNWLLNTPGDGKDGLAGWVTTIITSDNVDTDTLVLLTPDGKDWWKTAAAGTPLTKEDLQILSVEEWFKYFDLDVYLGTLSLEVLTAEGVQEQLLFLKEHQDSALSADILKTVTEAVTSVIENLDRSNLNLEDCGADFWAAVGNSASLSIAEDIRTAARAYADALTVFSFLVFDEQIKAENSPDMIMQQTLNASSSGIVEQAILYKSAYQNLVSQAALENTVFNLGYILLGSNTDYLSVGRTTSTVQLDLVKEYRTYQEIVTTYGRNAPQYAVIQNRMDEVAGLLLAYGLGEMRGADFYLNNNPASDVLSIGHTTLQRGSVYVTADTVSGNGTIEAKADAGLNLTISAEDHNDNGDTLQPMTVKVEEVGVGTGEGGRVRFFGAADWAASVSGVTVKENASVQPSIFVDQQRENSVLLVGNLNNVTGEIELKSKSAISVLGQVNAGILKVDAMGALTVAIEEDNAVFKTGGEAVGIENRTETNYILVTDGMGYSYYLVARIQYRYIVPMEKAASGALRALGDIYISADYINVNGLIQSGAREILATIQSGSQGGDSRWGDDGVYYLGYHLSEDDTQYVFDDIYVTGGNVWLRGEILATNKGLGEIRVYANPDVNITNLSDKAIVLGDIYTGDQNKETGIWIYDTAADSAHDGFTKMEDGVYKPVTKAKYHYLSGRTSGTRVEHETMTKKFLGIDALAKDDPDRWKQTSYKITNDQPLSITGGYVSTLSLNEIYAEIAKAGGGATFNYGTISSSASVADALGAQIKLKDGDSVTGYILSYQLKLDEQVSYYHWTYSHSLGLIKEYWTRKTTTTEYQNVIWLVIDCNQDIKLVSGNNGDALKGNGNVTVTGNAADVILAGTINAIGTIAISVTGAADIAAERGALLNSGSGDISLTTGSGDVRAEDGQLGLGSATGDVLVTASVGGELHLDAVAGSLTISGTAGLADLAALKDIRGGLKTDEARLSAGGSIMNSLTPFELTALSRPEVVLGATASSGSIAISSGDFLVLDQLVAAGGTVNVYSGQSITDHNDLEMADRADTARLQSLWDKVGLAAADENERASMLEDNTKAEAARLAALYQEYFRSAGDTTDGLSAEQLELRANQREAARMQLEAAFGPAALESYNENLAAADVADSYLASLVEGSVLLKSQLENEVEAALFNQTTSTLRTEVANIVAAEIVLTARGDIGDYHYKATSISGYLDKVADASLEAEELKLLWSSESTDRYLVKADNGSLVLVSQYDGATYAATDTLPDGKTVSALLADTTLNLRAGDMLVFQNEDLNVLLTKEDGALAFKAEGNALLGTGLADLNARANQNLNVSAGIAGEELRLKADGDLFLTDAGHDFIDGSGEQKGLLAGAASLLAAEASKGSIGKEGEEVLIGGHGRLRLRALEDIHVASLPGGDLYVEGVNADGSFSLTADNDLTLDQEVINIGAGSSLTAGNDLTLRGDSVTVGPKDLTDPADPDGPPLEAPRLSAQNDLSIEAAQDVTVRNADLEAENGDIAVTGGRDVNLEEGAGLTAGTDISLSATTGDVSVSDAQLEAAGDIDLSAARDVNLSASDLTAGSNIGVIGGENVSLEEGTGLTADVGDISLTAANQDVSVSDSQLEAGGGIAVTGGENVILTSTGLTAESGNIGIEADQVVSISDTTLTADIGDISLTGENYALRDSRLEAAGDIGLTGDTVSLLDDLSLAAGGNASVTLTDVNGDGTTRLALADGLDVSDGVNPAPLLVTGSANPAVIDELDLSRLSGSGATEINQPDGGSYQGSSLAVTFSALDSLTTGNGDDSLRLNGGSFNDIDLGGGENSVSASAQADWTLGDRSLGMTSGSAGIGSIRNVDILNGSGQDSLTYNGLGAANWLVDADNSGTVNSLRFNGISSVSHLSTGGGTFDLMARMDSVTLAAPQTLIVYDGGYFHDLAFASGVNVFDIRYRHTPTRPGLGAGYAGYGAGGYGYTAGSGYILAEGFLPDSWRGELELQAYTPGQAPSLDLILYSLPGTSTLDHSSLNLSVTMNAGYGSSNTATEENAEMRELSGLEEKVAEADSENETGVETEGNSATATGTQDHSTPREKDAEADSENETPEEMESNQ